MNIYEFYKDGERLELREERKIFMNFSNKNMSLLCLESAAFIHSSNCLTTNKFGIDTNNF